MVSKSVWLWPQRTTPNRWENNNCLKGGLGYFHKVQFTFRCDKMVAKHTNQVRTHRALAALSKYRKKSSWQYNLVGKDIFILLYVKVRFEF
jgi:hypothetical protein